MTCQRFDLTILVVDDDDTSLAIVANILSSWDYKVLTANSARNALKTLREFEGFFDLVIIEVHISGVMNGVEFQKRVKDEFRLPVIMMSTDNRKRVIMSKDQESGASLHLSKPICPDDFKDIWKHAMAARDKGKVVIDQNEYLRSGDQGKLPLGDLNSAAASKLTHESKGIKRCGKRKSSEMTDIEDQNARSSQVQKKPKIVWTTYLHNLFLLAIKQLGIDKAVPKKILEAMNVPYLTRENVASHLQKYRIFLKKVAERGILEGLSSRTLRSRFASGLSASVIKEIQQRSERLRSPVHQYLQNLSHQTENNRGTANYPLYKGLMPQNQQAFNYGYNSLDEVNNMQQKLLGSCGNNPVYQVNLSHNSAPIFPSYNVMGHHGLMTSSNGLTGSVFQNYDPILGINQSFRYGLGNGNNVASSSSSNNVPWISNSTCYPSSNTYGIQLNGGPQMVETGTKGQFNYNVGLNATIGNNNSFGLVNGTQTQNANMHVPVTPSEHGNSSLVNGWSDSGSGSDSDSANGNGCVSEVPAAALISNATQVENVSGIAQLPQQLDGLGNGPTNEHQFYNSGSISENGNNQMEDDLSELFMIVEGTRLLNEMEETVDVGECLNSDSSSSCNVMQSLEQHQTAGDVIVLPIKSGINQQNESLTSSDQNPNQDNRGFVDWETFDKLLVDNDSTGSNSSAIEQDWDMKLIEAFFCTDQN